MGGRALLRWLDAHTAGMEEWKQHIDNLPPHSLRTVANDEVLIDADMLRSDRDLLHIAEMARVTAVLVLDDRATVTDCDAHLEAGAVGVISKHESIGHLVSVVWAVTSGRDMADCRDIEIPAAREEGQHLAVGQVGERAPVAEVRGHLWPALLGVGA
jgi:DNA-binding NarL/FixJ family response regulator